MLLGYRPSGANLPVTAGVKSQFDAERAVKAASSLAVKSLGVNSPVWHAPRFVLEVSNFMGLRNLPRLEAVLGSTLAPEQVADYRNYLVHPGNRTRHKYEALQAKLGMLRIEPQSLLHQQVDPGLTVFTSWVRELQRVANASTR